MNVTEMSQLIDELLSEHNRQPLNDIQKAIIQGSWQGHSYQEIGDVHHRSESYIRDEGAKLWKLISEVLGEEIKKSNFRSSLERIYIKSSQNPNISIGTNNYFNFSSQTLNSVNGNHKNRDINPQCEPIYHDLTSAPQIINFYNRETELETLSKWIFNQNTRLISVLGLLGIGKTTLVKKFVDSRLDEFEVIIWKDLNFPKPLDLLINDILTFCQQEPKDNLDDKLQQLLLIFTHKKCLLILDDVQNLFIKNQFAGQYQSEYQPYQLFFNLIAETSHQSHLILMSQEKCSEMDGLDPELYPVQSLELKGLYNLQLLKNLKIDNEENGLTLINLYQGNCFYLKSIIQLIQNNYEGKVIDFLTENSRTGILPVKNTSSVETENSRTGILPVENTSSVETENSRTGILPVNPENNHQETSPIITTQIQAHFQEIFNNLSTIEQEILLKLNQFDQPISRENLRQNLTLSSVDFNNGLDSLQKRYLITKIHKETVLFNLFPLLKEYLSCRVSIKSN